MRGASAGFGQVAPFNLQLGDATRARFNITINIKPCLHIALSVDRAAAVRSSLSRSSQLSSVVTKALKSNGRSPARLTDQTPTFGSHPYFARGESDTRRIATLPETSTVRISTCVVATSIEHSGRSRSSRSK